MEKGRLEQITCDASKQVHTLGLISSSFPLDHHHQLQRDGTDNFPTPAIAGRALKGYNLCRSYLFSVSCLEPLYDVPAASRMDDSHHLPLCHSCIRFCGTEIALQRTEESSTIRQYHYPHHRMFSAPMHRLRIANAPSVSSKVSPHAIRAQQTPAPDRNNNHLGTSSDHDN